MSAFTKQFSDLLIAYLLQNNSSALVSPATLYLALHSDGTTAGNVAGVAPGDNAETEVYATELSYPSYQRQVITFGGSITGTDNSVLVNDNTPTFPVVDDGAGPIVVTGVSIWTAQRAGTFAASGTCIFQGAIDTTRELQDSDAIVIPAGTIAPRID